LWLTRPRTGRAGPGEGSRQAARTQRGGNLLYKKKMRPLPAEGPVKGKEKDGPGIRRELRQHAEEALLEVQREKGTISFRGTRSGKVKTKKEKDPAFPASSKNKARFLRKRKRGEKTLTGKVRRT